MSNKRRLGIMGGTFDPIHYGHLVAAEEALVQFNLDRVVFMPTGTPVAKAHELVSSAEHRYLMAVLATASNPDFEVSRMEVERPGPTYTVDTLEALHERHGKSADLYFITGADAVWEILTWKDPDRLAGLCRFIAVTRPGYDLDGARKMHEQAASTVQVDFIEVPALAISSTDIRRRVGARGPVKYLMPETVRAYIEKNGLYREVGGS